jgi:hypothetical protein
MAAPAGSTLDEESRPYWEGLDAERLGALTDGSALILTRG